MSLSYASQAQTTKGTVAFTGSLGYSKYNSKTDQKNNAIPFAEFEPPKNIQSSLTLSPSIGYFLKDNLEIGASMFYRYSKSDNISHSIIHTDGIRRIDRQYNSLHDTKEKGFGIYARKYKFLTEKLAMYGTLSVGHRKSTLNSVYSSTTSDFKDYSDTNTKHTMFSAVLSPGITFFASQKIGLNANLGAIAYNRDKREETSTYRESDQLQPLIQRSGSHTFNSLVISLSTLHLNFGLTYYLGK